MFTFNHFNFNVADLERSLQFYKDALGLEPVRRKEAEDGRHREMLEGILQILNEAADVLAGHLK